MELHAEIAKDNPSFNKVNDAMGEFTKNGFQWFSVAELHYDALLTNRMRG